MNLYVYVHNGPVQQLDSLGMCTDLCRWGDFKCKSLKVHILFPGAEVPNSWNSLVSFDIGCDKSFDTSDWFKLGKQIYDKMKEYAKNPPAGLANAMATFYSGGNWGKGMGLPVVAEMKYVCCSKIEPCFWASFFGWGRCWRWEWDKHYPQKKHKAAEVDFYSDISIPELSDHFGGELSAQADDMGTAVQKAIEEVRTAAKADCKRRAISKCIGKNACKCSLD